MTTNTAVGFETSHAAWHGGKLRTGLVVEPDQAIERAVPVPGEPGVIFAWAADQHTVLCKTLRFLGVELISTQARGDDAYEVSATDAAIAFADGAMLTRPSSLSRRGEADRMRAEFDRAGIAVTGQIPAPGLLDGSDVVLAPGVAFVGVGRRGNAFGRDALAEAAGARGYKLVEVKLAPDAPSLSAVMSVVSKDTIILGGDKVDPDAFAGFKTIVLERGEELAAGVLCLGERHVLADVRYRTALGAMRRAGLRVESIDLYEFGKIGLTPSMLVLALKRE
jgi:N-dimethylarginine dimethylaminohydrolase